MYQYFKRQYIDTCRF